MSDLRIQIQRRADAPTAREYGCDFRRILPWGRPGPSDTGMGVCTVAPDTATTAHSHEDFEHFYVIRGSGYVEVEGVRADIQPGDALVVEGDQVHRFVNTSTTEDLELLSVWSLGPLGGGS
ncbi:mannose-6-phosphate isomerase-like protein (cupin superfamily) [Catenulispora sp. GAS73]|uniref:cupin domain-containing protein n=1 Tax=Catenulispora sp. GAS73 TaxID=3156269 RepID=UPI00351893C8